MTGLLTLFGFASQVKSTFYYTFIKVNDEEYRYPERNLTRYTIHENEKNPKLTFPTCDIYVFIKYFIASRHFSRTRHSRQHPLLRMLNKNKTYPTELSATEPVHQHCRTTPVVFNNILKLNSFTATPHQIYF